MHQSRRVYKPERSHQLVDYERDADYRSRSPLGGGEIEFLFVCFSKGLTALEASRMYFRNFKKDLTASSIRKRFDKWKEDPMFERESQVYRRRPYPEEGAATLSLAQLTREEWEAIEDRIAELKLTSRADYLRMLLKNDLS